MEWTAPSLLEEALPVEALKNAACYFPPENGRYEVKPGLFPFGTDFGNGEADQQVFQLDENFSHYRRIKELARSQHLSQYYQTHEYSPQVAGVITQFICDRLIKEHPKYFHWSNLRNREYTLSCRLTGEDICFDKNFQSIQSSPNEKGKTLPYVSTLDALAAQVQEDLVVVSRVHEHHWVSAIHLCYPNHWAAEDKIGQNFAVVHAPVAGMQEINQREAALVRTMIERKPSVRFAWGFSTDTRLNHHPYPPSGIALEDWQGRHFNAQQSKLYLRIERQIIWGFPDVNAALFIIRTSFRDCRTLKHDRALQSKLILAIQSMPPESLTYKGLADSKAEILTWLQSSSY